MEILENKTVKEKAYLEELENGLKVIIVPKENTNKKMAIIGTKFGSIDNHFINPKTNEEITIPDGVAHFLEHKMFEQADGTNSLDNLTAIGAEANAYTTNDHTAYYFETIENFEEAFRELLNYVFHPYYTDENVEKEKGIIAQEIKMYDDDPISKVFLNSLKCMYNSCPVRIDVAGTVESINKINKETLYHCYNTFYHPSNMVLAVCGNFKPEYILNLIKENIPYYEKQEEIKRIYPSEQEEICKASMQEEMEVSIPAFVIGIKDEVEKTDIIKKELIINIILNCIFDENSELFKELYEEGLIITEPDLEYEYSDIYSQISIFASSKDPEKVYEKFKQTVKEKNENGINEKEFVRTKNKIYGRLITSYNSPAQIARIFMRDKLNNINTFEYIEKWKDIKIEDVNKMLKDKFKEEKMVLSVVKPKK